MSERKTLAIDLDGTLAEYRRGDFREGVIGPPLPGAREAMLRFRELGYRLLIHSARFGSDIVDGPAKRESIAESVVAWLKLHDIPFDDLWRGEGKPACWCYVDDAAIRFTGDWPMVVAEVEGLVMEPM